MNDIMGQSGGKPPRTGFRLDKGSSKVFGVCAGIGNYFGIDTMLVRVGFLIQAAPQALSIIAWIGTITAIMAALIATQQSDIKRILAYSMSLPRNT